MVLKKSNSALNSGATQKVTRGGFYNAYEGRNDGDVDNLVSINLERFSRLENESTQIQECLELIQVYLNWRVPNLSHILGRYDPNMHQFRRFSHLRGNEFSLNKGNCWDLATRISAMMKDVDFLRDLPSDIDLTYTEVSGQKKTIKASDVLKAHEVKQKEEPKKSVQTSKSRRRKTCHQRGVQRRHCLRSNGEIIEEVNREEENQLKTIINITLHAPFKADARTSKMTEGFDPYKGKKSKPSSFPKRKGFVNGMRSERRVYNHDINKLFMIYHTAEIEPVPQYLYNPPQDMYDDMDTEEEENYAMYSKPISYSLMDLVAKPTPVRNQVSDMHCADVNYDESLFDKRRHAKGSNIFIDSLDKELSKSWGVLDFTEDTASSPSLDAGYKSHVLENESDHEIELKDYFGTYMAKSNIQEDMEREQDVDNFEKSFSHVHTSVPGDGVSLFPEALNKLQVETGPHLMISNSLPHSICVLPTISKSQSYVIGTRASTDGKVWKFSLQGGSSSQQTDFATRLKSLEEHDDAIPLTKFIDIFREVVDSEVPSDIKDCDSSADKSQHLAQPGHLTWTEITRKNKTLTFCSPNDALEVIKQNTDSANITILQPSKNKTPNNHESSMPAPTEVRECGVCLSLCSLYGQKESSPGLMLFPCNHFYCLDCWREHIFQSLKCGSQQVTCMAHNCSTLVDDATLRSVVPHKVVNNWQKRLRDRQLEACTFCRWCPASKCGMLAISSDAPLQQQFGRPVISPCGQIWCGGCQAEPHWPASCDQMAAYRTVLAKARLHMHELERTVTFNIGLKPCPKCRYPIEKNEGCPSMVCRMCWFNFCWNCLKGTDNHNVYTCKVPPSSTFTIYSLTNKLVCDISVKYVMDGVAMSNRLSKLKQQLVWAQTVRQTQLSKYYRLPLKLVCQTSQENFERTSVQLLDDTIAFLHKAYTLTETFYVLMSFARLNKIKSTDRLVKSVAKTISRLIFLTERLSIHVIGKSLPHLFLAEKSARVLLKTGDGILEEMRVFVPTLQQASKDIDTAWVAKIDPEKHMHYK